MDWLDTGRTPSRPGWPPATWPRRRTRRGWRCSTCPARGWKARSARWPPAATPGTARKANCRSSTGCSPTPKAARSRSGSSPATPATPPRSPQIADVVRDKFGLAQMVMVGDRGMITSARIAALNQLEDGTARPDAYGWITALRAPAIRKLMADDGPLQLSLFDEQDLAEITSAGLPRRAADRLPQPGAGRRPRPQARGPAGRHREAARPHHRPGPGRAARRRRGDRGRGRQGDQQVQDRQALRRHHHR